VPIRSELDGQSRGAIVLQGAEESLKNSLNGRSWTEVERWLINFDDRIQEMQTNLQQRPSRLAEDNYWQLKGRVLAGQYNVELYALWQGPTANAQASYFSKNCQITPIASQDVQRPPVATSPITANIGTAKVQCGPVNGPFQGQPDRQTLPNSPTFRVTPQRP
jgi:hypothetical protein